MNARHSKLTDWGLSHITIREQDTVLDIGCGGGRTVNKLAALAGRGKVYGVDFSDASVAVASRTNKTWIDQGRVEIRHASVSQLPFPSDMFDVVTAIETHIWWPELAGDMRQVLRVLKPVGKLILIAEVYKGASNRTSKLAEKYQPLSGMRLLSVDEHRQLLSDTGYSEVQVIVDSGKRWICAMGNKPSTPDSFYVQ
jgi:ubiquinone/menaquinone biosynthesis C-methylase UbiE